MDDGVQKMRSLHSDFTLFKEHYPVLKASLPRSEAEWTYYQAGTITDPNPIVFLHGTSGTAAAFFYQVDGLGSKGYRVLSVQYPPYSNVEDWCKGFDSFLDVVKCRSVHIFGAGLGGFLAQHYAVRRANRVRSMLLCNAFTTTTAFAEKAGLLAGMIHITPTPILRKVVLDSFPQSGMMELSVKQAIDWVAQQVNDDLSGEDLAARLSLNCSNSSAEVVPHEQSKLTILESNGETMVPEDLRRDMMRRYPQAKVAHLQGGGDFPYLSSPSEVTLFIEVHMRGVGVFAATADQAPGAAPQASTVAQGVASAVAPGPPPTAWASEPLPHPLATPSQPAGPRPVWKNPFEDDDLL